MISTLKQLEAAVEKAKDDLGYMDQRVEDAEGDLEEAQDRLQRCVDFAEDAAYKLEEAEHALKQYKESIKGKTTDSTDPLQINWIHEHQSA